MNPRRLLSLFAPLWLGLQSALTLARLSGAIHEIVVASAELTAAALWIVPPTRRLGMVLMLAVMAAAMAIHLARGAFPGPIVFYAAVILYLWLEDGRDATARRLRADETATA